MKLSVACNFDPALLDALKGYPVYELYGKTTADIIGGGRASFTLPATGKRKLEKYVKSVHAAGMSFNYLINASCLENMESTRGGQRAIRKLLDWLAAIGVDAVTLNHPLLLKMIKKNYPFQTRIGVFAAVNTVQRAKFWENEGADCICLEDIAVNRDFELLAEMRRATACDLQLLVNNHCFYSCAMSGTHMNMLSHASQSKHKSKGFYVDYCMVRCTGDKLANPVNFIRASWIRPEDLKHYQAIGYENFKIVERMSPTWLLALRVKAYAEGRYGGNLLDLVQPYGHKEAGIGNTAKAARFLRYLLRPLSVNPLKLNKLRKIGDKQGMLSSLEGTPPVVIDNAALEGFIDRFKQQRCADTDCASCRHCHTAAERHVNVDDTFRHETLALYADLKEELETGRFWK